MITSVVLRYDFMTEIVNAFHHNESSIGESVSLSISQASTLISRLIDEGYEMQADVNGIILRRNEIQQPQAVLSAPIWSKP